MARSAAIVRIRMWRIVFVCAVLVGATIAAASPAGATGARAPSGISAAASTDNATLGGGDAVPDVLVAAGGPFTLTVTLTPAGATFNTDTKLILTASLASGADPGGSVSPTSIVMPGGFNSAQFNISYSAVDNGVKVTVAVAKATGKSSPVTPGTTAPFDVLKTIKTFQSTDSSLSVGVGDASCTQDTTESECGVVILPNGFLSPKGALSLGACTPDLRCTAGSQVVQFIADLGGAYSSTSPATLIIRCSKQLCRGKGVGHYTLKVSFKATGPLDLVSAPCTNKGVALDAAGNTFCTDYRRSHRDNAGDLLLFLLFVHDVRGSI